MLIHAAALYSIYGYKTVFREDTQGAVAKATTVLDTILRVAAHCLQYLRSI